MSANPRRSSDAHHIAGRSSNPIFSAEDPSSATVARGGSGRLVVPSALTVLAICAGLSAVRFALDHNISLAMAMIVAAALLDGIDGRVARLLGATTRMGAELDSLADAINFGVTPALVLYLYFLQGNPIGWFFALIFCCAIVLRLARFNTLLDNDLPGYAKDYFIGTPAPAAALIALLPIGLEEQFGSGWWTSDVAVCIWMVFTALLAVSRVPTASMKSLRIRPRWTAAVLVGVAVCAALAVTYPYVLMIAAVLGYLAHIPFAWRTQRWTAARPETWDFKPAERRAERRALRQLRRRGQPAKSAARLGLRRPR